MIRPSADRDTRPHMRLACVAILTAPAFTVTPLYTARPPATEIVCACRLPRGNRLSRIAGRLRDERRPIWAKSFETGKFEAPSRTREPTARENVRGGFVSEGGL